MTNVMPCRDVTKSEIFGLYRHNGSLAWMDDMPLCEARMTLGSGLYSARVHSPGSEDDEARQAVWLICMDISTWILRIYEPYTSN